MRELDDRDMLLDLLMTQKHLASSYDHASAEAASEQVRGDLLSLLEHEHLLQAAVFEMVNRKGWYKVRLARKDDLEDAHRRFSEEFSRSP